MDTDNPGLVGAPEAPVEMLPTHIAVTKDDTDKLAELVRRGESLTDPNTKETVLHAAARAGSKTAVEYILKEELVSPKSLSLSGHSAAHFAALYKQPEILKMILTHDSSISSQLAHQQDEAGHSLLSLVTLGGSKDMAKWLLEKYPDLAQSTNTNGNMAIHFAAAQGQLSILKMLIDKCGKEMAEKADFKQTKPVYFAAQEGHLKVLDYLVNELGVDPVARDKAGMCSVHAATQGRHPSTVKWLINKLGSSYILDKTGDGGTPLHMAAARGAVDILKFFLEKLENESDVNIQDSIKATPAHDAAEYGQTQAMILLLKAGADLSIQDMENKTPYQLAMGQDNDPELANLINDYRKGGLPAIAKYEKKRKKTRDESKGKERPRTSHQEAQELSAVIQETNEVVERRNEQSLQRQESLNRINEAGLEDPRSGGRGKPRGGFSDEDNDIEHHLGPLGGVYARPKKRSGSKHNSDIEDFIEETMSHKSFSSHRHRSPIGYPRPDDGGYATINHETASNVSRPSRVKRYHDSDSEVSSFAGSAGHFYHSGRYPGMPMGGGYPGFPPPLPPPRGSRGGPRSVASSRASGYSGQRMPLPPGVQYPGYHPGMMHPGAFYGWPGYHPGAYGMPMYAPSPLYLQRHRHQQMAGRRAALLNKKKKKGPVPNYDASAEASGNQTPRKHTDEDIGYGPSLTVPTKTTESSSFHPPAPPITQKDGTVDSEVVPHDSNFIMAKRTDDGQHTIRKHGEMTLNPNKNKAYDGRYDKYIMTDSESETELPDHVNIACAAESAAIIAIGCVAGLRGLAKMKREKPSKSNKAAAGISSAWDDTRGKHGGSSTALDDPSLRGLSPEEFASQEEWDKGDWDGGKKESKKEKKKKKKNKNKASSETPASPSDPDEPQSELLTAELHKMASASVSKNLGEQILSSALGARHSSMLNIASSAAGSRMSLNISSEEEADDDFNAAISMVAGTPLKDKVKAKEPMDLSKIGVSDKPSKDDKKSAKEKSSKESEEAKKQEKQSKKDQKQREKDELKEKKLQEQRNKEELKERKQREAKEREEQKARDKEQKAKDKEQKQREAKEKAAREKEQAKEKLVREKEQKVKDKEEQKAREKEQKLKEAQAKKDKAEKKAAESKAKRKSAETDTSKKLEKQKSTEGVKPQRKAPPPPASKGEGESREVPNTVTMFDTESESEPEDLNSNNNNNKVISGSFDPTPKPPPPASKPISAEIDLIAADEQSLDIFGADGLAELNDALRELSNIQSSFSDPFEIATTTPASKVATTTTPASKVAMTTRKSQERREGQVMSGNAQNKTKKSSKTAGAASRESRATKAVGGANGVTTSTGVASTSTATTQPSLTSTAVQGEAGYSTSFEENVLRILQGLTDTMAQMRANPSVTKNEIKQQELLQQQMIQNLISYSENNPQLTTKLLSMVKREQPHDESASSKSAYEMLEQKLLQAQEIQSRQAKDYFRTQEEFQASITRKLEEQAEQQLKLIQSNFEKYSQLLKEQQPEKKKKKKKRRGHDDSSSESDDDGFVKPMKQTQVSKPAVKTMQARIYRQDLLDDDSMRSSSQTSLTGKLKEKQLSRDKMLKRQETSLSFGHTQEAWKRFESVSSPIDEDEDDDEMLSPQIVRPVTLKKADIMKIRDQAREEELAEVRRAVQFNEPEQQQGQLRRISSGGKGIPPEKKMESFDIKYGNHVETNEHKKNVPAVDSTIAGAAGELATILKSRQRVISTH